MHERGRAVRKNANRTPQEAEKIAEKRHNDIFFTKEVNTRMKVPKQNRESLISFNERDDRVEVITYNTSLINRLTELHNNYPGFCKITCVDTETGRYELKKKKNCFSFRVANPYTRERKEAMRRYALENDTIAAVSGRKEKTNDRKGN